MYIDVLPLSDTTARLVRAYGEAPCIALPSVLPAPEGGSWAVTELGDYNDRIFLPSSNISRMQSTAM